MQTHLSAHLLWNIKSNLAAMVASASAMLKKKPSESWSTPDGAFYSIGPKSGKTALLFPGQGSQYTGMLRDLACAFPQMSSALTAADRGFVSLDKSRLSDRIYPISDFSEGAAISQEEQLRATDVWRQSAVSTDFRILESFGFQPMLGSNMAN
jgi:acyl transferase domain-containing protein